MKETTKLEEEKQISETPLAIKEEEESKEQMVEQKKEANEDE